MNAWTGIALTAGLLLLNALFVGCEFALVAARRSQLSERAEQGSRRARTVIAAMDDLSMMLAGAQLGITLCSVALGAISEPVIAAGIRPGIAAVGIPEGAAHPVAFTIALALVTMLHVVLGEMVPKNATLTAPDRAALWLAPGLRLFVRILRPVIAMLNVATNGLMHTMRVQPRPDVVSTVSAAQLSGELEQSRREGLVGADDAALVGNAVDFEQTQVAQLAVPLVRTYVLSPGASTVDVETLARRTGVTRFPVRVDADLTGYIHLKDVLATPAAHRDDPIPSARVRALPTVSADMTLPEAIDILRTSHSHIARVAAAGTPDRCLGVIALDDILASLTKQ